jgi:hypothetical protein
MDKPRRTFSPQELQELFDRGPVVTQEILSEFVKFEEQIRLARIDLDAIRAEVTDLLMSGAPVQRGPLDALFFSGILVVGPAVRANESREDDSQIPM